MRHRLALIPTLSLSAALAFGQLSDAEATTAEASPSTRALVDVFGATAVPEDRFSAHFLQQVPHAQVRQIVAGLHQTLGPLARVQQADTGYQLHFARGEVPAHITLDAEGRIAGLWIGPSQLHGNLAAHAAAIQALSGATALLVLTEGETVAAHQADTPLSVGSAAKLAVLQAVQQEVSRQHLRWDTVVPLKARWRSLPSGQLQHWPAGTPVTVATLAHLMISVSDNTATDALIDQVGRAAVETITPRNTPFLDTRELFHLKATAHAPQQVQWITGNHDTRRALLETIAQAPLVTVSDLSTTPAHDVGWLLSAHELCQLLENTAGLPSLHINPGPTPRNDWQSVAFKGGSDTGVLNLSSRLVGHDGRTHCVVATWNHRQALEDEQLMAPYRAIIRSLR
jgi:beta-lactamase class A